jgi:hypothetical protein
MTESITSTDGRLQIMRHSIVYPTMGPKGVQGAVKNLGDTPASAEIKVEFYDDAGSVLGQSSGVFQDIAPGEVRLFDIWAERLPNMYEVESHKIISLRNVSQSES